MLCDRCQQNVATVHLTEIAHKKKVERHLCEQCARETETTIKPEPLLSVPGPVIKTSPAPLARSSDALASLSCPVCGMTFTRFRSLGRLGCANDYVAFRRGLEPLLEKIHGTAEHRGRVPAQVSARKQRRQQLARLRQELNRAIETENYEQAAVLRDQIHALEEAEHG